MRKLLLTLSLCAALLLRTTNAFAAIAVDATGTFTGNNPTTSFNYTGITVGSGLSNGVLLVYIVWTAATTSITLTWDNGGTNQVMTPLVTGVSGTARRVSIYGLVNPTAGNKTLHVAWTGSAAYNLIAQSYTGVNQSGGATTWPNSNTNAGSGISPVLSVTSTSGNLPLAIVTCGGGTSVTAVGQTQIALGNPGSGASVGVQSTPGTGTANFSATLGQSGAFVYAGVDMVAAGGVSVAPLFLFSPALPGGL